MSFKNGDKVEWDEFSGSVICTGTIICEEVRENAAALGVHPNQFGHYTIAVDMDPIENYHRACHTAREMHSQWVSRSIVLHKLRLRVAA